MFVKPLSKYNKTTKERYSLYQLCESYRLDGRVRHRVIIGLGKLEDLPTNEQKIRLGKRIEEMVQGKMRLSLEKLDEQVERLAQYFYNEIRKKRRYDVKTNGPDWQMSRPDFSLHFLVLNPVSNLHFIFNPKYGLLFFKSLFLVFRT